MSLVIRLAVPLGTGRETGGLKNLLIKYYCSFMATRPSTFFCACCQLAGRMYPFDRIVHVHHIIARVMGSICPMFHLRRAFGPCSLCGFCGRRLDFRSLRYLMTTIAMISSSVEARESYVFRFCCVCIGDPLGCSLITAQYMRRIIRKYYSTHVLRSN